MKKPRYIVIEFETRERMKDNATYRQTYDMLINELLNLKEQKFQDE